MKEILPIIKDYLKKIPEIRTGDRIKIYQKRKEGKKERKVIFEGIVIAKKHGREIGATITVRNVIAHVGVEKIFPLHSPTILKIEVIKKGKARRAKLYYLREATGRKAKIKRRK